MTTLAEKRARLERIVDAIVCADDPGDMPIDDFAWVANILRLALHVVEVAQSSPSLDNIIFGSRNYGEFKERLQKALTHFEEAE